MRTFAINNDLPTFKPKPGVDTTRIGQRTDLSEKDVHNIKTVYKCGKFRT